MSIEVITSKNFNNFDLDEIKQLFNELNLEINTDNQRMVRRSIERLPSFGLLFPLLLF